MGRYSNSKLRVILFVALLVVATLLARDGFAQSTTQPAGGAAAGAAGDESAPKAGLIQLILAHPDPIFWTIAILSVTGLTLIIQGFIKNRSSVFMPETSTNTIREMIAQRRFRELIEFTETDPSFISRVLNPALKRAPSWPNMKEALETAVGEQTADRFRSIEYLNIIGNLGPLLGLLGTVLGMIYAFQEVSSTGGAANVSKLSYGISTALCHTFLGLFLAVPCLAAFGVLRTMVDRLTVRGALVAEELLIMMKPADAPRGGVVPPPPTAAAVPRSAVAAPPRVAPTA